jgi:alkanesulfonate monooxygenase SsuD/methylene tetrahydromethanopterin reductase-like flavin-dependent oxidoreductase (luciferase family)
MTADEGVEYGAHLPLIDLGTPPSLPALKACATAAARLGYRYLCANDHLVFGRPWLDGPTALAALIEASQDLTLVTTASLPVLRGPVQLARTLAAIDILSGGRLVAGVGPGSSAADYAAAGISFQERWPRFDEAVRVLRALLHGDSGGFEGEFYSTRDVPPEPRPGPPIWVASWGSPAGLRRVARLGDGWLASAYNTTPDRFRDGLERLAEELRRVGRAPDGFPVAVATTWLHVTEDRAAAERVLAEVLAPMLHRPGRGPVLGSPAGRPGRGVRRAAGRVRGRGRAPRLRLAARRRAAPAGAVPRARRLPHLTTRNQRLVAWDGWVRQLPHGRPLPTTSPSR